MAEVDRYRVLPEWAAAQAVVVHIARNHRADDQTTVTPEGMRHLNAALAALCEAVAREGVKAALGAAILMADGNDDGSEQDARAAVIAAAQAMVRETMHSAQPRPANYVYSAEEVIAALDAYADAVRAACPRCAYNDAARRNTTANR